MSTIALFEMMGHVAEDPSFFRELVIRLQIQRVEEEINAYLLVVNDNTEETMASLRDLKASIVEINRRIYQVFDGTELKIIQTDAKKIFEFEIEKSLKNINNFIGQVHDEVVKDMLMSFVVNMKKFKKKTETKLS